MTVTSRFLRQAFRDQVAGAVVGVLDPDLGCAGQDGALAGGGDLGGHLLACRPEIGVVQIGFVPVGDIGDAFDVGADIDFHKTPLWFFGPGSNIRGQVFPQRAALDIAV